MAEMKVLGQGEWRGRGELVSITETMIDSAIAQFKARGLLIPVDMQHYEEESYGWIKDLYKKDGDLWASIDWNPEGAELIQSGKFKYISPSIVFNGRDPKSGVVVPMELFSVAITNYPFMNDLSELKAMKARNDKLSTAKDAKVVMFSYDTDYNQSYILHGAKMDPKEILSKLLVAAGMPPETPPDQLVAFVKKLQEFLSMMPATPGGGVPTPDEAGGMMPEMVANHKLVGEMAKQFNCTAKDLKDVIARQLEEAKKVKNDKTDTDAETVALKAKVQQLEDKLEASKREIEADKFIATFSKKIAPAQQAAVKAAFMKNPEIVKSLYSDATPDIIVTLETPKAIDAKTLTLTDAQKEMASKAGVTEDEYKVQLAKDLARQQDFERQSRGGA